MSVERFIRGVLMAGAVLFVSTGAWLLGDPASFYEHVAVFAPYNRHFLHDAGAFQIGLGAALLLGLTGSSGRLVALWSVALAATLHAVAHAVDSDLGGRTSDPFVLGVFALAFVAAALLATPNIRKPTQSRTDATHPPSPGLRQDQFQSAPQPR